MNWNKRVRQAHRWLSIAFTVTVIIAFAALTGRLPFWVFYLPLPPLVLQLVSGLYLFVLPHVIKRRSRQRAALES